MGTISVKDAAGSTQTVNTLPTNDGTTLPVSGTVAVTGTFFQATQPVSGTFFQATQPISAAALPLPSGAATAAKQPVLGTAGTASTDVITVQGIASATPLNVASYAVTATTTVTRPADTTAYTAGDAIANSTSSPTAGGFTLTGMARASGGTGVITDLLIISSDTAALTGEVWIYDAAVTAQNDNAAMSVSDADQLKLVAKVPFTLVAEANNSVAHIQNLSVGYTCVGSADLRFLLKATGGTLTTTSGGTYTLRAKGIGNN